MHHIKTHQVVRPNSSNEAALSSIDNSILTATSNQDQESFGANLSQERSRTREFKLRSNLHPVNVDSPVSRNSSRDLLNETLEQGSPPRTILTRANENNIEHDKYGVLLWMCNYCNYVIIVIIVLSVPIVIVIYVIMLYNIR